MAEEDTARIFAVTPSPSIETADGLELVKVYEPLLLLIPDM
jgi:hypothetical protein